MAYYTGMKFPEEFANFARKGICFSTILNKQNDGREFSKVKWQAPLRVYYIDEVRCNKRQVEEISSFFQLHKGKGYCFSFPDQFDNIATDILLGYGDGKTRVFQLFKRYNFAGYEEIRDIYKPIKDTINIKVDGAGHSFKMSNIVGGKLELETAPKKGSEIKADFKFETVVRFDMDELIIEPGEGGSSVIRQMRLKEVLL